MIDTAENWLTRNFYEGLGLPQEAVDWLLDVWRMIQVFDDMADGDSIDRAALNAAIWAAFVTMPANPFYHAHVAVLQPALATAVLKWQASDAAERAGAATPTSFVWRAGYYDLVLLTVLLTKGHATAMQKASAVMQLYGETLDDYLKEFPPCPLPSPPSQ